MTDAGTGRPEPRRLRVAVLSVPFGGGHQAVAEGVEYALSQAPSIPSVCILDSLSVLSERLPLSQLGARLYCLLTRTHLRPIYAALFWAVDRWPVFAGRACSVLFQRRASRWLERCSPDVVVSTFPLVSYVLGAALKRHRGNPVRLITIVTDARQVNRAWFAGCVDGFAVTDDVTATFARGLVAGPAIVRVELPLRRGFDYRPQRATARAQLGIAAGPAVLIWGGGQGLARGIEELVDHLAYRQTGITPVVVTGRNERLAARLRRGAQASGALVLDYCDDVPALLSAVDAVIGKAGWVSLSEARAAGLPTVCIDALPGQELENLRVSAELGFAHWAANAAEAVDLIRLTHRFRSHTPPAAMARPDRERLCDLILRGTRQDAGALLNVV